MNSKLAILEKFERAVVLRSARILPLILSFVATLMLVAGALTLVYSFIPPLKPKEPAPVPEPPSVSISQSDIEAYLNPSKSTPSSTATEPVVSTPDTASTPRISREAMAIATELNSLRKQAAGLHLGWDNKYTTVCGRVFFGYCFDRRTVIASHGISGYVEDALKRHDDGSKEGEAVTVQGETYYVNPSQSEVKLAIIKELEGVLAKSSPDNAHKMVSAWAALREQREDAREEAFEKEKQRVAETYVKAQEKYEAAVVKRLQARNLSVMGVGLALGGFVLLGLVLAVLAIERHTRMLQEPSRASGNANTIRMSVAAPEP